MIRLSCVWKYQGQGVLRKVEERAEFVMDTQVGEHGAAGRHNTQPGPGDTTARAVEF